MSQPNEQGTGAPPLVGERSELVERLNKLVDEYGNACYTHGERYEQGHGAATMAFKASQLRIALREAIDALALDAVLKGAPPAPTAPAPASHVDFMQRRGAGWDVVVEAIQAYNSFYTDDDYDYRRALDDIVGRMKERYKLYHPPTVQAPQTEG